MSEPKLISPLLDGFVMGNAMSEQNGVTCHPALKESSDDKYIVKIISIPASQVQLEALLLTGAYKDPADAADYFTAEAEGIVKEAGILEKLSKLDGFLSYEGWQIVPMENGNLGNQVYLLGSYKRSLERHIRRSRMSHLEAVNLGLDLCQALAICRRIGYLYVNLKPSNVFISKNREFRIGDVGFVPLDTLKFNSLPGKYFSPYSPPESKDPLHSLDTTYDTYSAGMILYQVFNDGVLPAANADPAMPPVNADYEISAIIMKAISPDPADRWKDPMEMGQALVGYMQRNSVNNTPLSPQTELVTDPEAPVLIREAAEQTKILPNIKDITGTPPAQEPVHIPDEEPAEEPAEVAPEDREEAIAQEISSLFTSDKGPEMPDAPIVFAEPAPVAAPPQPDEEDDGFSLTGILDKEEPDDSDLIDESYIEDIPGFDEETAPKKSIFKKLFGIVAVLLLLALLGIGGFWYYQNLYIQRIQDLEVIGSLDTLTVRVDTTADNSILTVICTDTYGNAMTQPLVNGEAVFEDLLPNSQYKINLEMEGFHKLIGKTSEVFNTAAQTNVVSFTAIAGPEDGSVLLNMVVDGTEPENWTLSYTADGEEKKTHTFTGHSVTIKELAVGKTYTFTLQDPEESILTGNSSVEFTSTKLVMADNLQIISCSEGNLKVRWDCPEGMQIDTWTVRCYNDADYEQVQENVAATEATFTDVDTTRAYTVEVTAAGMTQPIRTSITSNPITVTNFSANEEETGEVTFTWDHEGKEPVGGWLLMYKVDNTEKASVMKCDDASATISPVVPGAAYHIEIQAADSTSIFSNLQEFKAKDAPSFELDDVVSDKVTASLLVTPGNSDWTYESISDDDFTDTFASGDPISVVLYSSNKFWLNEHEIDALYVIRDSEGNVRSDLITQEELNWRDLWYDGNTRYGELDLPVSPAEAGSYRVDIYFNSCFLASAPFTIQ